MPIPLKTKPGINGANVLSIPKDWDATWFRKFINNSLKGADVRNAIEGPGITITGNISSPYATISSTGGTPGGTTGEGQFNNGGTFGGIAPGTAGEVLTSNGPGTPPSFQPGGGGSTALPGTIPDLKLWWESDNILGANNEPVERLQERTPWITGVAAINDSPNIVPGTINAASLNGLNKVGFSTNVSGGYTITAPFILTLGATFFIVLNPASAAAQEAIIGSVGGGGLALYQNGNVGVPNISLVNTATAVLATATTAWTPGTFFQANVTYNPVNGAYAFRQSRAAAGAGSVTTGLNLIATTFIGSDDGPTAARLSVSSLAALMIYNRVLTGAEIIAVENYLFARGGV